MEHIYYADRPSVPNTQHNVVHLPAILEHSLLVNLDNIHNMLYANAVEVKDETGTVQGTLLYVGGVSLSTLISDEETASPIGTKDNLTEADATTDVNEDEYVADTKDGMLIDLERELAEARQDVADIEAEIESWRTNDLY